jgi:hypothetical protein
LIGFAAAIGVHPIVGYNNLFHLAPAIIGAAMFLVGLFLSYEPMMKASSSGDSEATVANG